MGNAQRGAPHFGSSAQTATTARIYRRLVHGILDFGEKFLSQPQLLPLIPYRGVGDIGFGLGSDNNPMTHGRSLA
jgi:hypothetical protein